MKKVCSIIAGGKKSSINIEDNSFVIACDKGLEYLNKTKYSADLIIGDFDSYNGKISKKSMVFSLPKEKNDTDLMVAIRYAIEHDFDVINLYCALGGRLDHELGNIQACTHASIHGIGVHVFDEDNELHFVSNSSISVPKKEGYSISILSLCDKSKGVTIKGAKYLLDNAELLNHEPLGISNEWENEINVEVKDGTLLVILSKIDS